MESNKDNLSLESLKQIVLNLQKEVEFLKKSNQEKKETLKVLEDQIKEKED